MVSLYRTLYIHTFIIIYLCCVYRKMQDHVYHCLSSPGFSVSLWPKIVSTSRHGARKLGAACGKTVAQRIPCEMQWKNLWLMDKIVLDIGRFTLYFIGCSCIIYIYLHTFISIYRLVHDTEILQLIWIDRSECCWLKSIIVFRSEAYHSQLGKTCAAIAKSEKERERERDKITSAVWIVLT